MVSDQASSENSDQATGDSENQGPSQVRSYECTFCKRGFSNAQALGGHMNIHRKDRAKLKHPSNDDQLALDINKRIASYAPISREQMFEQEPSDEKSFMSEWPRAMNKKDDPAQDETHETEIRQLPLFEEAPTGGINQRSVGRTRDEERKAQLGHSSVGEELDLELRLGPEPQDTSMVLKEFL